MLELTGTVKGKNFREEIVSADTLIELFDLTFKDQDNVRFELNKNNPRVMTTNLADGKPRHAIARTLVTFINGFYEGENVQIRYYTSKIPQANNKGFKYRPLRIEFNGDSKRLSLENNKEEVVFLSLFPQNIDSPLYNSRRNQGVFGMTDIVANAAKKLATNETKMELTQNILRADDDQAVYIALAIRVGTERIPASEASHPATAKVALLELANKHPAEVYQAWYSHSVQSAGAVLDAFNKGYIKRQPGLSGGTVWSWSKKLGGEEIVKSPKGKDAMDHLIAFLADRNNWMEFKTKLTPYWEKAVKNPEVIKTEKDSFEVETVIDEPVEDDFIQQAIDEHLLILHPTEDKAYLLDENQQLENRALMKIKDRENWVEEVKSKASKIQLNRVKKRLNS